ncbi:MAG: Wzt carbohydrate-binding domain-containing protein, partial [Vicinamibacterales bacterium]
LGLVERFCDEALWLDRGSMKGMGDPKRIIGAYITDVEVTEEEQLAAADAKAQESTVALSPDEPSTAVLPDHPVETVAAPADMFRATEGRWGSREVEITDVMFSSGDGQRGHVFHTGDRLNIRIRLRAALAIDDFVVGIGFFNAEGVCCYGTNTSLEEYKSESLLGDAEAVFTIESLDLVEGTYKLDVAVHKLDGYPYDYHRLLYTFRVKSRTKDVGIYRPRHEWRFSEGIKFSRVEGDAS